MDAITQQIAALDDMFYRLAIEQRDKAWRENDSLKAELALRNAEQVEFRQKITRLMVELRDLAARALAYQHDKGFVRYDTYQECANALQEILDASEKKS